jgi:hypothetical protein
MIFIILVFLSAFLLESIGTVISVLGLISLFGYNELIIALAVCFDVAKLTTVSFLYHEWKLMSNLMKLYLTLASLVLMLITSAGASGYLASQFQKAILPTKAIAVKVEALTSEKQKLELRKTEIDTQITNLPADFVRGRTKLLASFKAELDTLNSRIVELDKELPALQIDAIDKNAHAGPITYIASTFDTTPEQSMGIIIGLIIFVFDPLAVVLVLAGNYLVRKRPKRKRKEDLIHEIEKVQDDYIQHKQLAELDDLLEEELFDDIKKSILADDDLILTSDLPSPSITPLVQTEELPQEQDNEELEEKSPYFPPEMIEQAKEVVELTKPVHKSMLTDVRDLHSEVQMFDHPNDSLSKKSFYSSSKL